ncbi:hypothetical protein HW115_16170 [Verrucomicrobiaceae bacterium N1E253]|uniref:Secretory protein n=1 Tax=Oceaniferula marina TaxID=2748318 RepID=A0A851GJ05_9BACT|nr:basic secretory protein-like protein [Oceaniferula marina]NWK57159.1 hypothetical protein [Oceaniferula marina]
MRYLIPIITLIPALATASPIGKAKISSNLPAKDGHALELITDGKLDTYYQTKGKTKPGDWIQLSFPEALPTGKNLRVHTGISGSEDFFNGAVLEASSDGNSWKKIAVERAALIDSKIPANTTHLRLLATEANGHHIAVREIEFTDAASPVLIQKGTATLEGKTFQLSLATNLEGNEDLKPRFDEMAALYFDLWPQLVSILGSPLDDTYVDVDIHYRASMKYPAYADKSYIVISADHLRKNKADTIGVFVHELTHVIQHYPNYKPHWFIEGVADYTRYKLNPVEDNWKKRHRANIDLNKPLGAYWSSAAFLLYLEETYKKEIVKPVSIEVRNGTYTDDIWKKITGKELKQLTEEYKNSGWKIQS